MSYMQRIYRLNIPEADDPFVRFTAPADAELVRADTDYDITWDYNEIDSVDILFNPFAGFDMWDTIVKGQEASAGSYTWKTPQISSVKCKLRIRATADTLIADSTDHFGVKQDLLCRVDDDSLLIGFTPSIDGWSVTNTGSVCWPSSWYDR